MKQLKQTLRTTEEEVALVQGDTYRLSPTLLVTLYSCDVDGGAPHYFSIEDMCCELIEKGQINIGRYIYTLIEGE